MQTPTILGLSFSTRSQGMAVVKLNLLIGYSLKLYKKKWDSQKRDSILTSLATCVSDYNIRTIALSIPHAYHQTTEFRELYDAICVYATSLHITVVEYTPKDIITLCYAHQKKTKKNLMEYLALVYPELYQRYIKECTNKNKYYVKMFEAIGAATLHSQSLADWRF